MADYMRILQELNPDSKIRAWHVAAALEQRHTQKLKPDVFMEQVKTGSSYMGAPRILDAVAIRPSWTQPCITGYEIKVERSDFLRDEKWRDYLAYTNEFYFAAPKGIIDPSELPDEVGLIVFNPASKNVRVVRKATWREMEKTVAFDLIYYIVMWRCGRRNGRTNGEEAERYVENKIHFKELGKSVSSKLVKELNLAKEERDTYKCRVGVLEYHETELNEIKDLLLQHNIGDRWSSPLKNIQKLINARGEHLDNGLKQEITSIIQSAEILKKAIGE